MIKDKSKKITFNLVSVSILLCGIFMNLVLPTNIISVKAAQNDPFILSESEVSIPFEIDFDDDTAGSMPSNWEHRGMWGSTFSAPGTSMLVEADNAGNKVANLTQNQAATYGNYMHYYFTESDEAVLEYSFKVNNTTANGYLPALAYNNGRPNLPLYLRIDTGCKIMYCADNANWINIATVTAGEWHTLKEVVDISMNIRMLYIDGELITLDAAHLATTASAIKTDCQLSSIVTGFQQGWANAGTFYIDNISVTELVEGTSVQFENTVYEMDANTTLALEPVFTPVNTSVKGMTYVSSDSLIATVDASGVVTGVSEGEVTITATPVQSGLSPIVLTIRVNGSSPEDDTTIPFEINFDDDIVGSLPFKWEHRGMWGSTFSAPGTTMLVEADNAENKVVNLTQNQAATYGNYMHYYFTESDEAVLEYSFKVENTTANGYLPALAYDNGRPNLPLYLRVDTGCKIMYCADNANWIHIATVTAGEWHTLREVVDISKNIRMLYIDGDLLTLDAEHLATSASAIKVDCQLNSIVTGFQQGWINAGTFYIDDISVTELVEGTSLSFNKEAYQIVINSKCALKPVFSPTNTSIQSMTYTSSNPNVATVDSAGIVTGVAEGTATITATPVQPGLSPIMVTITVDGLLSGEIDTTIDEFNAPIGAHLFLDAEIISDQEDFEFDTSVEYVSSNTEVVTVDSYGEVLAIAPGNATITVTAVINPNIKKVISVTVQESTFVQKIIYVSPTGSGNGATAESATTLEGALEQIAGIDKTTMTGNVEVILTDGYYYRASALALTEDHGGNGTYSVIFKAADGAEPTIGGGIQLSGTSFTESDIPGVYVADVPAGTQTRELYINNIRAVRARSEGKLTNAEFLYDESGNEIGLVCDNTELLNYQKPSELEFYTLYLWRSGVIGVSEIRQGTAGRVEIIMDEEAWHDSRNGAPDEYLAYPENFIYYENAIELLDEPGEWYLDEVADKLYYKPRVWESMTDLTVTVPVMDCWVKSEEGETEAYCGLLTVIGSDYDHMVQNIRFEGITFADATYMRPSSVLGHDAEQGGYLRNGMNMFYQTSVDAAITVKKVNGIVFQNCNFTRLGTTAMRFTAGVQNVRINGNHFYDLSGGCIQIGDPNMRIGTLDNYVINWDNMNPTDVRMRNKNLDVINNYMHDFGVVYPSVAGVAIGFAEDCDMIHNELFNMSYIGLSIGQATSSYESYNQRNTAINNFIHDYMHGGIFDGGGIYMIGETKGGLTEGNYLRNQGADTAVLYLDNAARWWTVQNNVVDTSEHPYKIYTPNVLIWWFHANAYARDCVIRNNFSTNNSYAISSNQTENIVVENNMVVEDLNWPTEAQSIISVAGLQNAYLGLRNNQAERIITNMPEEGIALASTGSFQINVNITDGKDNAVNMNNSEVHYEIKDTAVATVSENGIVTAISKGTTILSVYVVSNDILDVIEKTVFIGDDLEQIELRNVSEGIELINVAGTHMQLEPYGVTENGREVTLTEVVYTIENSNIASVSANGVLSPISNGETMLTISGTVDGITLSVSYEVVVMTGGQTNYLNAIFEAENEQYWKGNGLDNQEITSWNCTDGVSVVAEVKGVRNYSGAQYGDEILTFNMVFDRVGTYGGITFRGQHDEQAMWGAQNEGYLICLHQDGIELHRFNNGIRTMFYGTLSGFDPLYGPAIQNFFWEDGQMHKIQVGAINEDEGVRLLMYVDGEVVFNVLDDSVDAVREAGYFGLEGNWNTEHTKTTKFTLQKIEE